MGGRLEHNLAGPNSLRHDRVDRFDPHAAGQATILRSTPSHRFTSLNLSRTATTLSSCHGASVLKPLCLASGHNAQQGVSFVDHLLYKLSVRLQGFLFAVVLVHDGSIRLAHDLRHHHWGARELSIFQTLSAV